MVVPLPMPFSTGRSLTEATRPISIIFPLIIFLQSVIVNGFLHRHYIKMPCYPIGEITGLWSLLTIPGQSIRQPHQYFLYLPVQVFMLPLMKYIVPVYNFLPKKKRSLYIGLMAAEPLHHQDTILQSHYK